jgi:hypothetical protein
MLRQASRTLYCSSMEPDETSPSVVWIGVVGVVPGEGCDLLSAESGAFINFLTLARSESEYRAKVAGALSYHQLDLLEFIDVRPFSPSDEPSEEILAIGAAIEGNCNQNHVRYATFHTFPRLM